MVEDMSWLEAFFLTCGGAGAAAVASPALWLLVEKKPPRKQMLGSRPPPPVADTVDELREGGREAREEPMVGTVLGWQG